MHKVSSSDTYPELCPIVSSIGTFNYDLLSPVGADDYFCKDSFLFLKLRTQIVPVNFLSPCNYHVTSLFTIIQLQETTDIAINLIFNHNPNLKITKKELKKLFLFATSQTRFLFNGKC